MAKKIAVVAGILMSAFGLVGCSVENKSETSFNPENLSYHQDSRTKLCYASSSMYSAKGRQDAFSNVPCTPEVFMHLKSK